MVVVCCLINLPCTSCMRNETEVGSFSPKLDIAVSLKNAVEEIQKVHDLNKPYELIARVSEKGEWVFTFSFLPKAPGSELIAVVGTNGVSILPGI